MQRMKLGGEEIETPIERTRLGGLDYDHAAQTGSCYTDFGSSANK